MSKKNLLVVTALLALGADVMASDDKESMLGRAGMRKMMTSAPKDKAVKPRELRDAEKADKKEKPKHEKKHVEGHKKEDKKEAAKKEKPKHEAKHHEKKHKEEKPKHEKKHVEGHKNAKEKKEKSKHEAKRNDNMHHDKRHVEGHKNHMNRKTRLHEKHDESAQKVVDHKGRELKRHHDDLQYKLDTAEDRHADKLENEANAKKADRERKKRVSSKDERDGRFPETGESVRLEHAKKELKASNDHIAKLEERLDAVNKKIAECTPAGQAKLRTQLTPLRAERSEIEKELKGLHEQREDLQDAIAKVKMDQFRAARDLSTAEHQALRLDRRDALMKHQMVRHHDLEVRLGRVTDPAVKPLEAQRKALDADEIRPTRDTLADKKKDVRKVEKKLGYNGHVWFGKTEEERADQRKQEALDGEVSSHRHQFTQKEHDLTKIREDFGLDKSAK